MSDPTTDYIQQLPEPERTKAQRIYETSFEYKALKRGEAINEAIAQYKDMFERIAAWFEKKFGSN